MAGGFKSRRQTHQRIFGVGILIADVAFRIIGDPTILVLELKNEIRDLPDLGEITDTKH
jgi:hypothetical protein